MFAVGDDPAPDLAERAAAKVQGERAVGMLLDALAGVPLTVADVVGHPWGEADGDVVRGVAALGPEASGEIGFGGEGGVAREVLVLAEGPFLDATDEEAAEVLAAVVEGDDLPAAARVVEVIGLDAALVALAGAGGEVTDVEWVAVARGGEEGEEEGGIGGGGDGGLEGVVVGELVEVHEDFLVEGDGEAGDRLAQGLLESGAEVVAREFDAEEEGEEFALADHDRGQGPGWVGVAVAAATAVVVQGRAAAVAHEGEIGADGALADLEAVHEGADGGIPTITDDGIDLEHASEAQGHDTSEYGSAADRQGYRPVPAGSN